MSGEDNGGSRTSLDRRALVASLGAVAAGVGSLAGCLGLRDDESSATETATDTVAPTATATDTETATETQRDTDTATETPVAGALDPANYGPPGDGEWEQTFADHFDAGELDESVWTIGPRDAGSRCAGAQVDACFVEDQVDVDAETNRLVLTASAETPEEPTDVRENERGNDYSVGAVRSEGAFAQEFGYFEAAARIPDEPGTLPACWLFCDPFEYDWREIELFEKMGAKDADVVTMGTWFEQDDDGPDGDGELTDNDDRIYVGASEDHGDVQVAGPVDEQFFVYGLEWGPESLTWYVDGEQVGHADHPGIAEYLPGQSLHWILNHNVYEPADWVGDPADADFPSQVEFEWVRAWQREEHS